MNTTGIIIGRLSPEEMVEIIVSSDSKQIRAKFIQLLQWFYTQEGDGDYVISENLK